MDCLFCKVVIGSIPAEIVKKSDRVTAFKDIAPQAPVHVLVIPNQHFENMSKVAESDLTLVGEIFDMASSVAREFGIDSYRTNINTGESAGQSVFHAHLHLLGGRTFAWPPG